MSYPSRRGWTGTSGRSPACRKSARSSSSPAPPTWSVAPPWPRWCCGRGPSWRRRTAPGRSTPGSAARRRPGPRAPGRRAATRSRLRPPWTSPETRSPDGSAVSREVTAKAPEMTSRQAAAPTQRRGVIRSSRPSPPAWRSASTGGIRLARRACRNPPRSASPTESRPASSTGHTAYAGSGLGPPPHGRRPAAQAGPMARKASAPPTTEQARLTTVSWVMTVDTTWPGVAPVSASRASDPRRESTTRLVE